MLLLIICLKVTQYFLFAMLINFVFKTIISEQY